MKHDAKADAESLGLLVTEIYLETGEPSTVKTLVEKSGWPASRVRKAIEASHGVLPGCRFTDSYVDVVERNYRTVVARRCVNAWEPSMGTLRALVLKLRG